VSASTLNNFNIEVLKAVAKGVTFSVSSGDDGAIGHGCLDSNGNYACDTNSPSASDNCACDADSGSSQSAGWTGAAWSGTGYFPSFPATSPYVTAVGATMGTDHLVPDLGEVERACQVTFI
jgi:subtilase family serine protease